ncbi:hypothetical protein Fmac_014576 [Flemingia macrophylla]|uniref:Uncharacterized protein n=1 Tax=Flemingia macrophylla TaxID=520843 RepID=A0ABD1MCV4_9FABA
MQEMGRCKVRIMSVGLAEAFVSATFNFPSFCSKRNKTWSGWCGSSNNCGNQFRTKEGLQCDIINVFKSLDRIANMAMLILLTVGSKLGRTLIVYRYLKIPTSEGIFHPSHSTSNAWLKRVTIHHLLNAPKIKSDLLFHEKENADLSDDEDYGGNDAVEINNAWDTFRAETHILIHQRKALSSFLDLYEDVFNEAEDLQVSVILVPFHKHQRIDGKLESRKEGPDDREAIAWSLRFSGSERVNLTIINFLLTSSLQNNHIESGQSENKEILTSLFGSETVNEIDNTFMVDFYNRYVTSGQIGKGGTGQSSLTIGMSDWEQEECPDLGTVGDVLASLDFYIHGSVLIVQQHRDANKGDELLDEGDEML